MDYGAPRRSPPVGAQSGNVADVDRWRYNEMTQDGTATGRRPTRDDVAQVAGVSSAVVSYVINGGPRAVAEPTRQRVLDAIAELEYMPNEIARSLAGRTTRTIGFIAPTLANPVWAGVSMGVTDIVGERSHLLVVCDVENDPGQDAKYAELLVAKRVDGVVLVPTAHTEVTLEILRKGRIPVVVLEREVSSAPSVTFDHVATGRKVTEYLIELGHRRIAILREQRTSLDSWMRYIGYEKALADAGITIDDRLVADAHASIEGSVVDGSLDAAAALLDVDPPPTAVFAHNDLMAIAVVQVARRRGLRVPEDLSVVGVDDIEAGRYTEPPLTTVPYPQRELGRTAARRLMELLDGTDGAVLTVIDSPDLVVRKSAAAPSYR